MSTSDADVLVVGAGPAGCAAAIELAQRGVEVCVVDRARFPREKCCGDGLTTGALRRLEALGLDAATVATFTPLTRLCVRSPSGRLASLPLGDDRGCAAAVVRRRELDAALVELARNQCVVREADGFVSLVQEPEGLRVTLESGAEIRARYVVAADGAWSPVRRALDHADGAPARRAVPSWYAFRAYARDVDERALEALWVLFDEDLLPGYAWSFPVGETVNLGICCARAPGERGAVLARRWDETLHNGFIQGLLGRRAVLDAPARAWPIPAGVRDESLSAAGGRVLFAGDAAGAADPFTGEGIAQALETGAACAAALDGDLALPGRVAATYSRAVRRELGRDHLVAWQLRRLFSSSLGARAAVRASGATPLLRREVGRWLYEDFPRAIALSPHHWRRGALSAPTPYLAGDSAGG